MPDELKKYIDEVAKYVSGLAAHSDKKDAELWEQITSIRQQQSEDEEVKNLEFQKELLSSLFQKEAQYSNLVMIIGYAGTFAVWQLTRETLNAALAPWIGLMLIVSVISFALYEVIKMVDTNFLIRRLVRVLQKKNVTGEEYRVLWKLAWKNFELRHLILWPPLFLLSVVTGFGAGGLLVYSFVCQII